MWMECPTEDFDENYSPAVTIGRLINQLKIINTLKKEIFLVKQKLLFSKTVSHELKVKHITRMSCNESL